MHYRYKNIYVYWGEFSHLTLLCKHAQARALTAVYHLTDYHEQDWWKCRKLLTLGAGVQHPYINYILLSCFICPICYKQVMSMTSTHIGNLMAMRQQGTWVWKWGKTWQASSQSSLWYWGYQNDIRWELRQSHFMSTATPGQRLSEMLSIRNSASHLTDNLLLQWFISPRG